MKKTRCCTQFLLILILFLSCKNSPGNKINSSDEKISKNTAIPEKFHGDLQIGVETEGTTTGMASISYYFSISKQGAILKTNTYHEPIRCNGKYRGKMKNNVLELYYEGSEENCGDENSNFKIKKEGEQFFIQGLGGEGTFNEWIKIDKKD